jgi:hypothetical protein
MRRPTGGPGPEADLSAFLHRREAENLAGEAECFADRAGGWLDLMAQAADLPLTTRSCMGFPLWSLASLGQHGDRMGAAVTAARIAAFESKGAVFVPLAVGGAGGLLTGGPPADRLARWLDGMDTAGLAAMRNLDNIAARSAPSEIVMATLSVKTPASLRAVQTE